MITNGPTQLIKIGAMVYNDQTSDDNEEKDRKRVVRFKVYSAKSSQLGKSGLLKSTNNTSLLNVGEKMKMKVIVFACKNRA